MRKTVSLAVLLTAAVALAGCMQPQPQLGVVGEVHWHADLKVFLNGAAFNFSQPKYMSSENNSLSRFTHLHDLNGNVLHVHAKGVTLGLFFKSLGMTFNSTCFVTDTGVAYCNSGDKTLKLFVNGHENSEFENYQPQDVDRILITYGNESAEELRTQTGSVSSDACIYSEKCPEKGKPPSEASCVGADCKA